MREKITVRNVTNLFELTQVKAGWITQVVWSPDGAMLAIAAGESVRLYAGSFGGQPTHLMEGHTAPVKSIAFSPDSRILASASADKTVRLWDVADPKLGIREAAVIQAHDDSVEGVAFSPDGKTLATCSTDGSIYLWDVVSRQRKASLEGHEQEVSSVIFALNGHVVVSAGRDNTIHLWDVSAETQGTLVGQHGDWVREICTNPAGTMVASASKDSNVRLWDTYTGDLYATIHAHEGGADCVGFTPDSALMATGGRDHLVRIWYVQKVLGDGKAKLEDAFVTLEGHEKPVLSLAFNPAGTLLATGSGDNTVRLWSVEAPVDSLGSKVQRGTETTPLAPQE